MVQGEVWGNKKELNPRKASNEVNRWGWVGAKATAASGYVPVLDFDFSMLLPDILDARYLVSFYHYFELSSFELRTFWNMKFYMWDLKINVFGKTKLPYDILFCV